MKSRQGAERENGDTGASAPRFITIEMVNAGVRALDAWDRDSEPEQLIVTEIYFRMKDLERAAKLKALS